MTEVLRVDPARPDPAAIERAADCLRRGGLVAFPTETVYGLGADALDRRAVARLFAVKGRPSNDPLIVHVASIEQARSIVSDLPACAALLAERYWPGPLTLVMSRGSAVPDEVTAGLDTVAVRVPSHPVARALITAAGIPVAAPSANLFSRPSPTRAQHVLDDLADQIDMILDGGPTEVGLESTVLDVTRTPPTVLRPGAVTPEMLRTMLPDVMASRETTSVSGPLRSPGLLTQHYSPRAQLTLYEGDRRRVLERLGSDARHAIAQNRRVGILLAQDDELDFRDDRVHVRRLGPEHDLRAVAAELYDALREFDSAGVDVVLARGFPPHEGLGLAIQDRLRRAAAGRIITS